MRPIFLSRPCWYQKIVLPSLFNVWPFKGIYTNFCRQDGHGSNKGNSKFLLKKIHRFAYCYVFLGEKTKMFKTPFTMKLTLLITTGLLLFLQRYHQILSYVGIRWLKVKHSLSCSKTWKFFKNILRHMQCQSHACCETKHKHKPTIRWILINDR